VKAEKLRKILEKWTNEVKPTAAEITAEVKEENDARDATAAIDMEHLAMYTDGDKEQEKELFGIFMEQADICIKVLDDNAIGGSCEEWRKSSHKLKGAAANLGAHKLAELCKDAESSHLETSERKLELKVHIEAELNKVRDFINAQ
jgi:HPt (histidine-containing phosphotransfer) domain-containing protein